MLRLPCLHPAARCWGAAPATATCLLLGSPLLSHTHLSGLCLLLPDLCLALPCPPGAGGILRGTPAAWGQSASSAPPVSRRSSAPRWLPRQVGTACPPFPCAAGLPSPSRHGGARGSGSIWLWLHMAPADSSTECPRHLTACFLCRPSQAQVSTSTGPLRDGRALGPSPGIALRWSWCQAGTGVFGSQWWQLGGHSSTVWPWHVLPQPLIPCPGPEDV